jgi:hypothetical protein
LGERQLERGHQPLAIENLHPELPERATEQAFHGAGHGGLGVSGGEEDSDDRGGHRV